VFQGFEDEGSVITRRSASFLQLGFCEAFELSEQPDRMFSVISTGRTEFIEDDGSFLRGCLFVAYKDGFDIFFL